ncbi:MAG: RNA 2',3'-cyclic phosphodiesterase [Bacteroidales bacterium]|nr:RNA 2',3'-cyclic phosphodiesterase [Bacteroidales bacterium]
MKRTFVAIKIPISKNTKELLNEFKIILKDERIRWVEDNNIHITILFLGDTEESKINEISDKLTKALSGVKTFDISCVGLGVFRSVFNPKALWFGIEKSNSLENIYRAIEEVMSSFGIVSEHREFKPHLTIGRAKIIKDKDRLRKLLNNYKEIEIQKLKISQVYFYESKLTPQGSIYEILAKIQLC